MPRAFAIEADRTVSRLSRVDLAHCERIVDGLYSLSPLEGWLLLKEIRALELEVERLGGKVERP